MGTAGEAEREKVRKKNNTHEDGTLNYCYTIITEIFISKRQPTKKKQQQQQQQQQQEILIDCFSARRCDQQAWASCEINTSLLPFVEPDVIKWLRDREKTKNKKCAHLPSQRRNSRESLPWPTRPAPSRELPQGTVNVTWWETGWKNIHRRDLKTNSVDQSRCRFGADVPYRALSCMTATALMQYWGRELGG